MAAKVTASKKAAAKRPSRPRTQAPAPAPEQESSPLDPGTGEFEVLRLTRRPDRAEDRVPLFYIDDVEYTVPARPNANVGLQMLHLFRTRGEAAAQDYLLEKLLGSEGYAALREYDDLTPQQYQHICQVVVKLALGSLELPKE